MKKLETGNIGTRHSLRSACLRGPLRPLRGSAFGLGQPDDFVAGASPLGSRTPARGGYGNTSTLATINKIIAVVALLASCGCITRTGEYYQDTRARYVSPVSTTFCRAGQIPVVGWFVFLPVGLVGCGLEIAVLNPVRDTLMLPIDVFQPYHGYYVRVIDEFGSPVVGADVGIDGIGHSEIFWSDSGDKGTTGKDGMVYFPHLNYLPSQIDVNADGFHKRRGDMFHVRGVDRDVCPDRAKGPSWSTDAEGRRVYTVRIFRRKRPTALRRIRVDACFCMLRKHGPMDMMW